MTDSSRKRLAEYKRQLRARMRRNPVGLQCNMDTFQYDKGRYYNIGEMNLVCEHCQACGYRGENKGTPVKPNFGKMCCCHKKYIMKRIPDPPESMRHLFSILL